MLPYIIEIEGNACNKGRTRACALLVFAGQCFYTECYLEKKGERVEGRGGGRRDCARSKN